MLGKRQWCTAAIFAAMVCILNFSAAPTQASPTYVGVNLAWIAYGHSFDADGLHGYASSYNSSTVQAAFDDMKSKHLNMCRVFIFDDLEGVISNGNLNTIITPSTTYLNNLTDFVNRANADGVTVYVTMFNAWDFVSWPSTLRINPNTVFNNSALYSSTGPIQKVAHALAGKQVIWDFMNEGNNLAQYYSGGWKDLAGWVNMNSWISQTRAAVRAGGSTGNFTITVNDPNVLLYQTGTSDTSDLLNRNNLDFYDCHFYNDNGAIGFSTSTLNDGKPCFVGEFGPGSQNWASTGDNKTALVDSFWNSAGSTGMSGLLVWAYLDDGNGNQTQGTAQLTELGNKVGGGGTTVPAAPTNLTATAGNAQIGLTWSASTGASSYSVYRGTTSGGEGSTPITSGLTGTSYTNTGLANGTKYYYKVAAVNSAGTSGQSSETSATPASTVTVPSAPTGLAATAGNAQVNLSWSATSGATSYNIYRSTTSGGEGSTAVASGITSSSYINTGLTNGTKYYYKVAAVNSVGTSGQSSEVSATPTAGGGSGPLTFTATAPTNQQWYTQEELAVTVPGGTSVTACTVTITDQLKSGDVYGNLWTNGGNWTTSHATGSAITFTYTLSSGTLASGQQWWAQVNSNQQQPVSGDTYSVAYTANGTQYTASGVF